MAKYGNINYTAHEALSNSFDDTNNNIAITNDSLGAGEDLSARDVQAVQSKPVVGASYSGTAFANFGAATNANVRAAETQIKSIHAQNENAAIRYLQIFNLAAAPTEDTSVPVFSFAIPAGTGAAPGIIEIGANFFGEGGYYLSSGLSWGISVDPDVFDANAVTAGEHQVNGICA